MQLLAVRMSSQFTRGRNDSRTAHAYQDGHGQFSKRVSSHGRASLGTASLLHLRCPGGLSSAPERLSAGLVQAFPQTVNNRRDKTSKLPGFSIQLLRTEPHSSLQYAANHIPTSHDIWLSPIRNGNGEGADVVGNYSVRHIHSLLPRVRLHTCSLGDSVKVGCEHVSVVVAPLSLDDRHDPLQPVSTFCFGTGFNSPFVSLLNCPTQVM